jgi:hypothetical protein
VVGDSVGDAVGDSVGDSEISGIGRKQKSFVSVKAKTADGSKVGASGQSQETK